MKKIATVAFLIICINIGFFGVQKFEVKKMLMLGGGLFAAGVGILAVQSLDKKKKPVKRGRNVPNL